MGSGEVLHGERFILAVHHHLGVCTERRGHKDSRDPPGRRSHRLPRGGRCEAREVPPLPSQKTPPLAAAAEQLRAHGRGTARRRCLWRDFTPRRPTGRRRGARGPAEVAVAAGWPVPTTGEAGIEFDGAAGEQGEPGLRQRKGRQSQKPFAGLGAAWPEERGLPPASATRSRALGSVSALPSEESCGNKTGRRQ